jgi:hypothetical protein
MTKKKHWTEGDTVDITHTLYDAQGATVTTTSGTVTFWWRFNEGPWQSASGSVSGTTGVTYTFATPGLADHGLMEWKFYWVANGGASHYWTPVESRQVVPKPG